jgi:hypothetical protein
VASEQRRGPRRELVALLQRRGLNERFEFLLRFFIDLRGSPAAVAVVEALTAFGLEAVEPLRPAEAGG